MSVSMRAAQGEGMATIVHLSDVHLVAEETAKKKKQEKILSSMESALRRDVGAGRADLVVITGDVFDTSTVPWSQAVEVFDVLVGHLRRALGDETPIVVLPGNHDRRASGVFGTHDPELFRNLGGHADATLQVAGAKGPGLVEIVAAPTVPARVVAFDSTYLPRGYASAGGWLRPEDLLQMASMVSGDPPGLPLVLLTHHHLVPTPLTDVGAIDVEGRPWWQRFLVEKALPRILANADREELTMTALGAGTALSLLHSLSRPVIVLHGHKHYPTARVLSSTIAGEGDIALTSAGSTGTSEPWRPTTHPGAMRLWPSFNVLQLAADTLEVEAIAFSPDDPDAATRHRALLSSRRHGSRWEVRPVDDAPEFEALVELNAAEFALEAKTTYPDDAFDLTCRRTLRAVGPLAYQETIEGLPGGELVVEGQPTQRLPAELEVPSNRTLPYVARRAVCSNLRSGVESYGPGTAHEWVGLVNRYGTKEAVLSLSPGACASAVGTVFGSLTDLNTGRERPLPVVRNGSTFELRAVNCAPRTLLRIYWCLQ